LTDKQKQDSLIVKHIIFQNIYTVFHKKTTQLRLASLYPWQIMTSALRH